MIEDVFGSPAVRALEEQAMKDFFRWEELLCVSIDATMKCCLPVLGQAPWRASAATRAQAAFDDASSLRRVLTMRGRTGAVAIVKPIAGENAPDVCQA